MTRKQLVRKAIRDALIAGVIIGLLVGWAVTRSVNELGFQAFGICGECGKKIR